MTKILVKIIPVIIGLLIIVTITCLSGDEDLPKIENDNLYKEGGIDHEIDGESRQGRDSGDYPLLVTTIDTNTPIPAPPTNTSSGSSSSSSSSGSDDMWGSSGGTSAGGIETPSQIAHVSKSPSNTSCSINWQVNDMSACSDVQYGKDGAYDQTETPNSSDDIIWDVRLTNLDPDTTYSFRITCGSNTHEDTFKTTS